MDLKRRSKKEMKKKMGKIIRKKKNKKHTILLNKLQEAFLSVAPVSILIVILCMTPAVDLSGKEMLTFIISSVFLTFGIALFNLGAELAMTPMGEFIGTGLSKSQKLSILLAVSFVMGILITIAEPDLAVLAKQVGNVIDSTVLTFVIGIGVGCFLLLGVIKIVLKKDQISLLLLCYLIVFALVSLMLERNRGIFLSLAFDSGGVTTGPITVPFIMALGIGISRIIGGKNAQENSFGLVALCSVGPILAMLILPLFSDGNASIITGSYLLDSPETMIIDTFFTVIKEVSAAMAMIVVLFLILQVTILKMSIQSLIKIFSGIVYTLIGLTVFLTAVNIGYMPIGYRVGTELADCGTPMVVLIAFILGMTTVLAEPAIHVLNQQVEEVTDGTVSRKQMMIALSVGVGLSIALSAIRAVIGFSLLYYIIPGYIISLVLSFFVPKLYTAIAFDSGGVASGPLTSGFILPLITGFCMTIHGEGAILNNAFGIVAMVAMTPLIAIQILGFRAVIITHRQRKASMKRIFRSGDSEVIYFEW